MRQIDSISNPVIQRLKAMRRGGGELFLAEGEHLVAEALASVGVEELFVRRDDLPRFEGYAHACQEKGAEVYCLSQRAFGAISATKTPQGILAVARRPQADLPQDPPGTLAIALDCLQDPGNMGTVLRTALSAGGAFALAGPGCADFWGGKTIRASMGAVFRLPLYTANDLPRALEGLKSHGWHVACGHLRGGDFFARPRHEKTILVVGSEGSGVSKGVEDAASALYRLPMAKGAESLNAAVAAGIMLYDLWRNG